MTTEPVTIPCDEGVSAASLPDAEAMALGVLMPAFEGPTLPDDWAALLTEGLGGICLFGSNLSDGFVSLRRLTDAIRSARDATLIGIDEEGGDVTRLYRAAGSPVLGAAALGAAGDLALTRAAGARVAADLRAAGIAIDLAPVADVNSNADNPVIGTRSFSAGAEDAARHVVAWTEGLQAHGVAACVKHFPGHGDTGEDSHLALPVLDLPAELIRARELIPFAAAVRAGAAAVMTSHILVPALDAQRPGTLSAAVLGLLRDELAFDGVIVSDALDMAGASAGRGIPAAAVLSLAAGTDLLCIGADKDAALVREIQTAIVDAVAGGDLPRERLADAARRVAALAARWNVPRDRASDAAALDPMSAPPDPAQVAGARAAITVDGELPRLTGAPVISIETVVNVAVGPGPWGLEPDEILAPEDALPTEGPLIVQVRDAHRHPPVLAQLAAAGARQPLVIVEWGWPGPYQGRGARICTRGYSQPAVLAVSEILGRAGWSR